MLEDDDLAAGSPSLWSDPWMRAGLIHPVFFVVPWVILAYLLASIPGSAIGSVAWAFWVIPLSALASFAATVRMVVRADGRAVRGLALVGVGLVASGAALAGGFWAWLRIAEIACHGAYECPF